MTKAIYEASMVSFEVISIEHGFAQSDLGGANQPGAPVRENENYNYDL